MRLDRRLSSLALLALTLALGSGCESGLTRSLGLGGASATSAQGDVAPGYPAGEQQGSGLKGGEVDDNAQFEAYLSYLSSYSGGGVVPLDVSDRYQFWLRDTASRSVSNATLTVLAGSDEVFSAKSASNGRVLFFPRAFPLAAQASDSFTVRVEKGAQQFTRTIPRGAERSVVLDWPDARAQIPPKVDLCFTLDVTGSMGDELSRIQTTIGDIAARIKSLPDAPALRYGLVAYRDRGDDFVTRPFDFTSDLETFRSRLDSLAAAGGGDYPEALNEGVGTSIDALGWDASESVRLMFVVGDAPPHLDYPQDPPYTTHMVKAARRGIKIYPLGASGLDARGEYVFRQMAQFTGGKFLFLTYGGQTSHQVGPVQENNLDDLVVGIVKAELADLK
ncbi:MAG TPA: vWA domain-containing protein [Pantanalinema sp.]